MLLFFFTRMPCLFLLGEFKCDEIHSRSWTWILNRDYGYSYRRYIFHPVGQKPKQPHINASTFIALRIINRDFKQ